MRTLHAQNPELSASGRKRYTIVPPSVHREGNKKTIFANIAEICKRMHRQPEHVISFLFAELGTTGSVDGEKRLVIKGRFQPKQLENVLRRYIGMCLVFLCIACFAHNNLTINFFYHSRIRHLQNLQIPRHNPYEGEPPLLHDLRVLWLEAISQRHQDWFPGSDRQEKKEGRIDANRPLSPSSPCLAPIRRFYYLTIVAYLIPVYSYACKLVLYC